jgi:diketogulonate reductase-like aldo/keto reductase
MKINGKEIHPIGIGTWAMGGARFADGTAYADYDHDEQCVDAIRYSVSKGQNHIDTAQLYGVGHTEEIVGQAVRDLKREALVIASKVNKTHALRSAVTRSAEGMLQRLGIDRLDLLYIHGPWDVVPMKEYVDGINDALEAGLTDTIGVSNFGFEQLKEALSITRHPIVADQVHYSLLDRRIVTREFIDLCLKENILIVAYRPLERRLLADRCTNNTLLRLAEKYSRPASQIALNWLLAQEGVVTIPKATKREHIDENLASLEFTLEQEDMETLNALEREEYQ